MEYYKPNNKEEFAGMEQAFETTYKIVTGQIRLAEIKDRGQGIFMLYDPCDLNEEGLEDVLNNIIDYFIENEDYEKCQKIKDLLDSNLKTIIPKITYSDEDINIVPPPTNVVDEMIDMLKNLTKNKLDTSSIEIDLGFTNLELWSMMTDLDRNIFDNNFEKFVIWSDKLDVRLRNFYTDRLIQEKPLIPLSPPSNKKKPTAKNPFEFEELYNDNGDNDYNNLVVSFVNNYTCISNYDKKRIYKIRYNLVTLGILNSEIRQKTVDGKTIHTLIFDGKNNCDRIFWN